MKRMIIKASDVSTYGEFELVRKSDLDVELPDRIVLTDNGAYDLRKKGINGIYTWVGYEHKGSRSEQNMVRAVRNAAYNIVAPALAEYANMPEDAIEIDDFINSFDMLRVWVELP